MDINQMYFKELKNTNSTQEKTVELILKARSGCTSAKQQLIQNYLLHVVKIAREYLNMGVPLEDLIQEGNIGLITAIEKYDLNNGSPFGAYSKFWIKQSIIRNCMHKRRIVRLPENISELIRKDAWKGADEYTEFSIDLPYEDGGSFSEKLPSDSENTFFASEEQMILHKKVEKILSFLKKRDAEVLKAHYGIGHEQPMEIEEIAELFSLTTTRINQILRNSLKLLRDLNEEPTKNDGIKIIRASYGSDDITIDVTEKVVSLFENGESIKASNKLAGDPCRGIAKSLIITYTISGKSLTKKVTEGSYLKF